MRIDLTQLPVGGLLISLLLAATIGTFTAALVFAGGPATNMTDTTGDPTSTLALPEQGRQIAAANGCFSCHSITGQVIVGPSWAGLFGKTVPLADGSTVLVDEAYIRESILDPLAKVAAGFSPVMPPFSALTEDDIQAVAAYIETLE